MINPLLFLMILALPITTLLTGAMELSSKIESNVSQTYNYDTAAPKEIQLLEPSLEYFLIGAEIKITHQFQI